ncbi:MAG: hypothetical protein RIT02_2234, partial [Planctomycetota bacterium]
GERWFPVANTVIEQVHSQLARAKAHATVAGPRCHECPRKTRSRHSAFFRVLQRPKKTHTQNNLPCPPRSQHSRLRFKPPLTPPHQRFLFRVFRVFRGERWFPVANTVIEQSHAQLARAKAHATVAGAQNKVTSFRVFPRPKKAQREILCLAADCFVRVVDCDPGRAKLALSRMPVSPLDRPVRREPRPPEGVPARRWPRPPKRRSLALPRGNLGLPPATFLPQPFFQQSRFAFGLSQCRFQIRRQTEGVQ